MTYSSSIIMNYYLPFPSFRTIWTFCFENERRGVWDGGAAGSTDKLGIFHQKLFNFHAKVCLKESGGGEDLIHQRMHLSDKPYLPPLPISAAIPPLLIQNSLISSIYALTAQQHYYIRVEKQFTVIFNLMKFDIYVSVISIPSFSFTCLLPFHKHFHS